LFGQRNLITNMSSELTCVMCLDSEAECLGQKKGFTKSPCGHSMCMTCFLQWYDNGGTCPTCRGGFKENGTIEQGDKNGNVASVEQGDKNGNVASVEQGDKNGNGAPGIWRRWWGWRYW